jgi:DNA-binding MarR family transcriptional regulator
MVELGYSSEYEVFLTKNNGVQIVTNSLSIAILREMRFHEVTPSEVAGILGIPKTTVQGSIGKLLRQGILSQEIRIDDARSAVYRIDASLMLCSDSDVEWQLYARSASVARIMKNGRCTTREDLSLYGVSLTESGLNIVQGLFNVGAALTRGDFDRAWWDEMLGHMMDQCSALGISADFKSRDGLTIAFASEENIADVPLLVVPMLGAIISHSKDVVGYHLAHDVTIDVSDNGRHVELHVPRFDGQEYEVRTSHTYTPSSFDLSEPFSIYSIEGKATLFTNSTMISVLFLLSNSDYSLGELIDLSGMSKATIYTAITKLIGMGAVTSVKEPGESMKYRLLADPILYITEEKKKDVGRLESIVRDFRNGSLDYYSAVIAYSMAVFDCTGIHFDRLFIKAGRNAAIPVLENYPEIQPQEFVDLSCSMVSVPDVAVIDTYIPIRVKLTLSKNTLWEAWPGDFVKGFISEGLNNLLGCDSKIIIDVKRES